MTDVFPHTVWVRFERGKESVVSPSFKVGDLDGVQVLNLSGWSGRGGEQIEQTFRQLIPRRVAAPSESERNAEQIGSIVVLRGSKVHSYSDTARRSHSAPH